MSITTLSTHRQKLWTPFDDLGTFLGTPRRDDESLRDFKNRIKTVFTDRAGTHYEGLINGIAQEFGLEKKIVVTRPTLGDFIMVAVATALLIILGEKVLELSWFINICVVFTVNLIIINQFSEK